MQTLGYRQRDIMKRATYLLPLLSSLFVFGCQSAKPTAEPASTTGATATTSAPSPTKPDSGSTSPAPATADSGPSLDVIPSELKHEGYDYYGLANSKPMDMVATSTSGKDTMTGAQITKLESYKDGKAVFSIERTGRLADFGSQKVTLEKDGIYVTYSSMAKVDHDLEVPATLPPGKEWKNRMVIDAPAQQTELNSVFKVVGEVDVKTKVGDRKALLITSSGQGTMRGEKVKLTSQNWYVKGVGGVKSLITITHANGKSDSITLEETK